MTTHTTASPVATGPFEREPVGLGRLLSESFSDAVSGEEIHRRCVGWLTGRLDDAGVALGAADREIVDVIACEGWSVAQVVAGWVARAHEGEGGDDPLASAGGRFPLTAPVGTPPSTDTPSPGRLRPWGLRDLVEAPAPRSGTPVWERYDHERQVGVDAAGAPFVTAGDPSADTTATTDGQDPPSAEDWDNDFCPDESPRA